MKLWKNGAWLKSNTPDSVSTEAGQALKYRIHHHTGRFQGGVSASSLAASDAVPG